MQRSILSLALLAGLTVSSPVPAQENRLQPDFTFKRIGVPSGRSNGRITVQIDPAAARPLAPQPPAAPAAAGAGGPAQPAPRQTNLSWFWEAVAPEASKSGPGRLDDALRAIANAPSGKGVPAPRLQTVQDIAARHGRDILRETVGTRVSPALVIALISVESAGRTDAVSTAGAAGLMQLMPDTAARFGVTDRMNPAQNIKAGVAYLDWLMGHFQNDPILVLAGYNAGEGAVRDNAGVPPYAETRDYVPKVLAAFSVARGLCQTPPELVSDGCVFNVSGG